MLISSFSIGTPSTHLLTVVLNVLIAFALSGCGQTVRLHVAPREWSGPGLYVYLSHDRHFESNPQGVLSVPYSLELIVVNATGDTVYMLNGGDHQSAPITVHYQDRQGEWISFDHDNGGVGPGMRHYKELAPVNSLSDLPSGS